MNTGATQRSPFTTPSLTLKFLEKSVDYSAWAESSASPVKNFLGHATVKTLNLTILPLAMAIDCLAKFLFATFANLKAACILFCNALIDSKEALKYLQSNEAPPKDLAVEKSIEVLEEEFRAVKESNETLKATIVEKERLYLRQTKDKLDKEMKFQIYELQEDIADLINENNLLRNDNAILKGENPFLNELTSQKEGSPLDEDVKELEELVLQLKIKFELQENLIFQYQGEILVYQEKIQALTQELSQVTRLFERSKRRISRNLTNLSFIGIQEKTEKQDSQISVNSPLTSPQAKINVFYDSALEQLPKSPNRAMHSLTPFKKAPLDRTTEIHWQPMQTAPSEFPTTDKVTITHWRPRQKILPETPPNITLPPPKGAQEAPAQTNSVVPKKLDFDDITDHNF